MRILLINPKPIGYTRSVSTPLGLLSIGSTLQSVGHHVRLYDRTVEKVSFEDVLTEETPGLIGISLVSVMSIKDTMLLAEEAKKRNIPVVIGGAFASCLPENILNNMPADAVSLGEGELTWSELAQAYAREDKDLSAIEGLVYRGKNGELIRTPDRPFADLGTLAPINWELIDVEKYFQSSFGCQKMLYLYAAKGCPNSCSFCYNKMFHRSTYRKRPLYMLTDEIEYLVKNYGLDGVYFADELWCRSRSDMRETCDALRTLDLDFKWGCQTRIGLFNEEDFRYMYDSGCRWVFFGVESGSERILEKMNKHIRLERIPVDITACKKSGITPIASFICGYPDETQEDLKKTVELIKKLDTTYINLNFFALMPGSDAYYQMISEGRYSFPEDLRELIGMKPVQKIEFRFSNIPDREMLVVRAWYMKRSFFSVSEESNGVFVFAEKVVIDALKSIRTGSFAEFFFSTFSAGTEFLSVMWYALMYPGIRKKYGLK